MEMESGNSKSVTFKSGSKKIQIRKSSSSGLSLLEEMNRLAKDNTLTADEKTDVLKKMLE